MVFRFWANRGLFVDKLNSILLETKRSMKSFILFSLCMFSCRKQLLVDYIMVTKEHPIQRSKVTSKFRYLVVH